MITIYRCTVCGFESQDKNEVIEHEKGHTLEFTVTHTVRGETKRAKVLASPADAEGFTVITIVTGDQRKYRNEYLVSNADIRELFALVSKVQTDVEYINPAQVVELARLEEVTDETNETDGAVAELLQDEEATIHNDRADTE